MRMAIFSIGFLIAYGLVEGQAPSTRNGSPDSLIASIDRLLQNPSVTSSVWMALLDSAEARSDVSLTLSANLLPWHCHLDNAAPERRTFASVMLGAFVAGNMREQLRSGKKMDSPVQGLKAVLSVYGMLRNRSPEFTDRTLDEWSVLEKNKRLSSLVDSLVLQPEQKCG